MKCLIWIVLILLLASCAGQNTATDTAVSKPICLYKDTPAVEYEIIRNYHVGKNSYGSVNDIMPAFIQKVKKSNADAIINYSASQRFGFWPWRFIRPVVKGTAVRWKDGQTVDCLETGGTLYQ